MAPRLTQEAVYDALRVLRGGEDTVIILRHQGHTMPLEPVIGVGRAELLEEALQQTMASWVHGREVRNTLKGVGAVAATTARDLHLRQHMMAALQNGHVHIRHHLLQVDGQEETGCAAAYDCRSLHAVGRGEREALAVGKRFKVMIVIKVD